MRAGAVRPPCSVAPARAINPSHGVAAKRYNRVGVDDDDFVVRPGRPTSCPAIAGPARRAARKSRSRH
jgi:hypothetical protein